MLVEDRPVLRYGLDKTKVRPARAASSAERIAEALDIEASTYVERVRAAGPEAFVEALVLRVEDAREDVDPGYAQIPGAVAIEDQLPLAPTREFAAELLGRVGPATAEMIEESGGEIEAGDVVGTSGLQARYDDRLGGTPGLEVVAVGADDRRRRLFRAAPDHGRDLVTTIDPALQMRAEEVLATLGRTGRVPPSSRSVRRTARCWRLPTARATGAQRRDGRAVRAGLHVQGGHRAGVAARRRRARRRRLLQRHGHRRRSTVRELRRLPRR